MDKSAAENNNRNIVQVVRAITAGSPVRERCSTTGHYVISMESGGKRNRGLGTSKWHRCRRGTVCETAVGCKRYESSSVSKRGCRQTETTKTNRAWKTDLVDLPICRPADAESPQWRKGPAHKPQLCNACGTRYRRSGVLTPLQPVENRRRPTSLQCAMKSQKELRCCPAFQGIEGPPLVTQ
mmetsp:Transcript_2795/g.17403  ORF Transcript_2795/g.17403 Transcript_2795/m.17403 type:complete len:182 (+) Transcript_2795:319-864(+)